MMGRGTYTRAMLENEFRRRGVDYEIIIELDSMDMIKHYVELGMGVSVGPRLAIDPEDHETLGVVGLGPPAAGRAGGRRHAAGKDPVHPGQGVHTDAEGRHGRRFGLGAPAAARARRPPGAR